MYFILAQAILVLRTFKLQKQALQSMFGSPFQARDQYKNQKQPENTTIVNKLTIDGLQYSAGWIGADERGFYVKVGGTDALFPWSDVASAIGGVTTTECFCLPSPPQTVVALPGFTVKIYTTRYVNLVKSYYDQHKGQ